MLLAFLGKKKKRIPLWIEGC